MNKIISNDEIFLEGQWIPDGPPRILLPPGVEPNIELTVDLDSYCRQYYEASGRYLGCFNNQAAADSSDPYRYARKFIPGNRLPWETR